MLLRLFKAALAAVGGLTAPGNIPLERMSGTQMLDGGGRGGGGVGKPFFSLSEGVLMASYAAAAYCAPEALSNWTCDRCDGRVAGFEPTTVMYDHSWWGRVHRVSVLATSSTVSCAGARRVIHQVVYKCSPTCHPPRFRPSFVELNGIL